MNVPQNLKYTKEHEWLNVSGDTAVVGITEFAQSELGEIVFADLPQIGKKVAAGDSFCVVESTKAASDVYAPIGGEVTGINSKLESEPSLINSLPHTDGWLVKLGKINKEEVAKLMSAAEYRQFLGAKVS